MRRNSSVFLIHSLWSLRSLCSVSSARIREKVDGSMARILTYCIRRRKSPVLWEDTEKEQSKNLGGGSHSFTLLIRGCVLDREEVRLG